MTKEVIKRDGTIEPFDATEITDKLVKLCKQFNYDVDITIVVNKVVNWLPEQVNTIEIDRLTSDACNAIFLVTGNKVYSMLAGAVTLNNINKSTYPFCEMVERYLHKFNSKFFKFVIIHRDRLFRMISYDTEANYDSVSMFTRHYLLKEFEDSTGIRLDKKGAIIIERLDSMYLRAAIVISGYDINKVEICFKLLKQKCISLPTPTLFNSGRVNAQLTSCFIITTGDSLIEWQNTINDLTSIYQFAGGVALDITCIRQAGSPINSTDETIDGLVTTFLRLVNACSAISQGGKRVGTCTVYIDPIHPETLNAIGQRLPNTGIFNHRDIHYGLVLTDTFMKRVERNEQWHFLDIYKVFHKLGIDMTQLHGHDYEHMYKLLENTFYSKTQPLGEKGKSNELVESVSAKELFGLICLNIKQCGEPYVIFKDTINKYNMNPQAGTITCSNLCTEIMQAAKPNMPAVCNLASVNLLTCIQDGKFNLSILSKIVKECVFALDNVLDDTMNVGSSENYIDAYRSMGIGMAGLASVLQNLNLPYSYDCEETIKLNKDIARTMYFSAVHASAYLAKLKGRFKNYEGSKFEEGILNPNLYGFDFSSSYEEKVAKMVKKYGVRNAHHIALMPTQTSSRLINVSQSFLPIRCNMYKDDHNLGSYMYINDLCVQMLQSYGYTNKEISDTLMENGGSVQPFKRVPPHDKAVFATAFETKQYDVINLAADRQPFVDQGQSLTFTLEKVTATKISLLLFYAWKKQLSNGIYYLTTAHKIGKNADNTAITNNNDIGETCSTDMECLSCQS